MVEGVIDILIANATIQTLVGQNAALDKYKVYPVIAPQTEKYPYIVVRLSSRVRGAKNCGYESSVDVISVHKSYDEVTDLDDAVITALEAAGNSVISYLNLTNTSDGWIQGDGDGLYTRTSTFAGNES